MDKNEKRKEKNRKEKWRGKRDEGAPAKQRARLCSTSGRGRCGGGGCGASRSLCTFTLEAGAAAALPRTAVRFHGNDGARVRVTHGSPRRNAGKSQQGNGANWPPGNPPPKSTADGFTHTHTHTQRGQAGSGPHLTDMQHHKHA